MSFRLTLQETVPQGIRRIVLEEIDCAVTGLRNPDPAGRDDSIHEARRSIKKLRSIVRLMAPVLDEGGKQENLTLRKAGRALSSIRDAAALIETVESLSERYSGDVAVEQLAMMRSALRRRLEQKVRNEDHRAPARAAVAALREVKRQVPFWMFTEDGFDALQPGFLETYRRGRKALKRALLDHSPENLHSLRKRVKDHWYQLRLLEVNATSKDSCEKHLRHVQEWLGDDHDLTVLREAIEADPAAFGGKTVTSVVSPLIEKSQKDLRDRAFSASQKIYREKPKVYIEGVAKAWQTCREELPPAKRSVPASAHRRVSAA